MTDHDDSVPAGSDQGRITLDHVFERNRPLNLVEDWPSLAFTRVPAYVARIQCRVASKILFGDIASSRLRNNKVRPYFCGHRTIARRTGLSVASVTNGIAELRKLKLLYGSVDDGGYKLRWFPRIPEDLDEEGRELKCVQEIGDLTPTIFRHCRWYAYFHLVTGPDPDAPDSRLFQLVKHYYPQTAAFDLLMLGYVFARAQPVMRCSNIRAASDLGVDRKRIAASLQRLESLYLISASNQKVVVPVVNPWYDLSLWDRAEVADFVERLEQEIKGEQ